MAPAGAALAVAAAVCFLLVAPAPARRPADLPPQVVVLPDAVDSEDAAEPLLLPKPVADADLTTTMPAVPEEEEEEEGGSARPLSSLLCLVFRCDDGDEANAVAVRGGDSQDGWWWPQTAGTGDAEVGGDDDSDSDCESDSDNEEEDEGGIVGWFWSLAHRF